MPDQALSRRALLGTAVVTAASAATARPSPARSAAPLPPPPVPLERQPIAIFSKHLQWLDYAAAAQAAAAAGFQALDIPVRPGGHVLPERVKEDLPRAVEAARRAGLEVTMITTAITGVDDPHAEDVLRTAAGLDIGHYRMGYVRYENGVRETLDQTVARWRELATLNESLGIRAGYQNHSGVNLGAAVWDLLLVLEEVGSPWVGCQYDIRHAVVEGAHSWVRDLEAMAPFIRTLVAKDFAWAPREEGLRVLNVPFGEGLVPVLDWVAELRRLGLSAPLSMHFEYPQPDTGRRAWAVEQYGRDRAALRRALAPAEETTP
jgi:sugar phosphate isomerase/epimerase